EAHANLPLRPGGWDRAPALPDRPVHFGSRDKPLPPAPSPKRRGGEDPSLPSFTPSPKRGGGRGEGFVVQRFGCFSAPGRGIHSGKRWRTSRNASAASAGPRSGSA